jgi:4-phospho-D-threonate 3-dehydrogenase / 4-phospho-D-erythronate 3-dehydrogenase
MGTTPKPMIAITVGDPAGIGPEITVKALDLGRKWIQRRVIPIVIGDARVIAQAVRIAGSDLGIRIVDQPEEGAEEGAVINVLDIKNVKMDRLKHGRADAMAGRASYQYIVKAAELARAGRVSAIVTGPVSKEAINKAGLPFTGHTELLAGLFGVKEYAMMLAHGSFRVSHVTTHSSLREACKRVKKRRVLSVIRLTDQTLKRFGIEHPKIAVAGLNPHAGEDRLFGDEDRKEIAPAVVAARREGIGAEGPIAPDTVFTKLKGGLYDAVVVMYHDQGHIPVKLLGFSLKKGGKDWSQMGGINMTMGLPVIRTSVDHGVAFGKAGEGRANPQSMLDAIKMAIRLIERDKRNRIDD